jgi:branched-chain amino acid transport system permease protein
VYALDLLLNGLIFGAIYALTAVGLTLVHGLPRILHIAHAAVYAFGAFAAVVVANASGSVALGFLAAIVASAALGCAIYRFLHQPLLGHPPYVAMIASMGLVVFMEDGFRLVFGEQGLTFANDPCPSHVVTVLGLTVNAAQILIMAAATLCLGALWLVATRTRSGIAWRATVSNPTMAACSGIEARAVRYGVFFVGSALAGLAGAAIALLDNSVEPSMGFVTSYKALAIIVLGGLGGVGGTLAASFALGIVESFGTIALGAYLDRDALALLFLIAVLLARSRGFAEAAAP